MELDLGLAASFIVLVEERHYGRAAARLHLTSPALTKRIQRLERQLGVAVVERGPGGVLDVTAAGRRFAAAIEPLIAQASAACEAARNQPQRYTVRIGFPAGAAAMLTRVGVTAIVRDVHRSYPEARFIGREISFAAINDCLPDDMVDVLWTSAPVRHTKVASFPLMASSGLIGVVGPHHPFAEAGSIAAAAFCEEPMLYNPAIPEEWMDPFWLADIRPRREARLVETGGTDAGSVLRDAVKGIAVMTAVSIERPRLGSWLRPVTLVGAARMRLYAACRRSDGRSAVHALIEAFQAIPPNACP